MLEKKDWGMLKIGDEANSRKIKFSFCSLLLTSAEKHMNLFLKVPLSNIIVQFKLFISNSTSLKPNKRRKYIKIWLSESCRIFCVFRSFPFSTHFLFLSFVAVIFLRQLHGYYRYKKIMKWLDIKVPTYYKTHVLYVYRWVFPKW